MQRFFTSLNREGLANMWLNSRSSFRFWDNVVGWMVFAIATLSYWATMEPTTSLWDCSEFIATSYKLEVGHPPGAPLYMMLARIASLFASSPEDVPLMINGMNSLFSGFTILFMFWTITHLARYDTTSKVGNGPEHEEYRETTKQRVHAINHQRHILGRRCKE